jgi:hypothetical protein
MFIYDQVETPGSEMKYGIIYCLSNPISKLCAIVIGLRGVFDIVVVSMYLYGLHT